MQSVDLETPDIVPGYAAAARALGLKGIYVAAPAEIGPALDVAFTLDGPSVVEVRIDDRATPIHSFKRRMQEPDEKPRPRPGTAYRAAGVEDLPEL